MASLPLIRMGPIDPKRPVVVFDGAISSQMIEHPFREFAAEITFQLQHPQLKKLASEKPPMHFHPHQKEWIQVLEGALGVDVGAESYILTSTDGEFCVRAWEHHRLYPISNTASNVTRFILSGSRTDEKYRLDTLFFSNWYGYQEECYQNEKKYDMVQVLSMFDAGGSYLSLPGWVPFGRTLSMMIGIALGRWIGSVMGYQPFYRKWSFDWERSCDKMETSIFQSRFAIRDKAD
ncbi:hypothetical protein BDV96DRAFT_577283 [Lophiotrema nucula]|uniref:Uncharacterized protein n=1 Tax=Lophiotrema nucula TaxID=690887 RepID=A0A6A5Z6E4_9PLEO|nr:hypothetical protein BDV96DRAFT_577283 [Lophiotrema nucula]